MRAGRLGRLEEIQRALLSVIEECSEESETCLRRQFHSCLSPVAWHIGHCVYVEALWIRGYLLDDLGLAKELEALYQPELSDKDNRANGLPESAKLVKWARQAMHEHIDILHSHRFITRKSADLLRQENYLAEFLINHHAQHLETIAMASFVGRQTSSAEDLSNVTILTPGSDGMVLKSVPGGLYEVGSRKGFAFDNELPKQSVELQSFEVAELPVNNAQFLAFIEDGGYENRSLWSNFGWRWKIETGTQSPRSWHRGIEGEWYLPNIGNSDGCVDFRPVTGLTHHESSAFATWAGLRLVHEYEWEVAARLQLLSGLGEVWEWCSNLLHPYQGFSPYPYKEYSIPWFDQRHYVLRGGSKFTQSEIKRPSFRNYYLADADYLFSGIRLAK